MLPGWYILGDIYARSANVIFAHDLSPASSASLLTRPRDPINPNQPEWQGQPRLLIWPAPTSLEACVTICKEINLELPRLINVEIRTGENDISKCVLLLRAASAGLRVHTAKAAVHSGRAQIVDKTQPGIIVFDRLSAGVSAHVRLPFTVETELKTIIVRLELTYTTSEGEFIYACNSKLPILLPLAINVQDVFKEGWLFSRFIIGTANSMPLRIFHCRLEGNDNFHVESPPLTGVELDIFGLQPLSFVSKIQRKSDRQMAENTNQSAKSRLYLRIEYRCLDEEICTAVKSLFSAALESTSFQVYSRILKSTLLVTLLKTFSVQLLEATGLDREFHLAEFNESEWESPLSGLRDVERHALAAWLKNWHEVRM